MKRSRSYASVMRRWYRPIEHECPQCHRPLRQAMTLSKRTVITLAGVIKLSHAGSRCPDLQCTGHQRTYRSVEADALALPGFTYGLDIVLLVGQLRLGQHQTVDEVHRELQVRLASLGVSISRREILYLFEAYCTLLRASSEAKDDQQWLAQVEKNGGIIVSVDGIQPEKGNETVYVVRDALTGRVLAAENVTSSETAVIKALLAPVVALSVKVLGTITDAQESELMAVEQLWPKVPHQVCQFHALRDASQLACEADKQVKTAMRKTLQPKVRALRRQLKGDSAQASTSEAEQFCVLDEYASGVLSALNRDGLAPFDFATVHSAEDLDEVEASEAAAGKKGGAVSWLCGQRLARLQTIVAERAVWASQQAQVKGMHGWLLQIEHLLDSSWAQEGEEVSNETVGSRLDGWCEQMTDPLSDGTLSDLEHECLTRFLCVLANLRSHLVQCYDRKDFPRTNNEMERSIRGLKTRSRRISGRKNWNSYLLRYGRSVAYYDWWEQDAAHHQQLVEHTAHLDPARWRNMRRETSTAQSEQLQRFRFRHKRQAYLASLEARWETAAPTLPLP